MQNIINSWDSESLFDHKVSVHFYSTLVIKSRRQLFTGGV